MAWPLIVLVCRIRERKAVGEGRTLKRIETRIMKAMSGELALDRAIAAQERECAQNWRI